MNVVINNFEQLIKLKMQNNKYLDILDDVGGRFKKHQQTGNLEEAGGILIGYVHRIYKSVVIEKATEPQKEDKRTFLGFLRKSKYHIEAVKIAKRTNSGYIGNWHTHPCDVPNPSITDYSSWKKSLDKESSTCGSLFFIIVGRNGYRVWEGNIKTKEIIENFEKIKI